MECPCGCEICGEIFDLEDGYPSERLNQLLGNTVICQSCGEKEKAEIERDEEISDLKEEIEEAEYSINAAKTRLKELNYEFPEGGNEIL